MSLFKIDFDPNGVYQHVSTWELTEACGLLLPWACDVSCIDADKPLKQTMDDFYQFGLHPFPAESQINERGQLIYPGDPVLDPVAKVVRHRASGDDTLLIYQYGIVAMKDAGVCNGKP